MNHHNMTNLEFIKLINGYFSRTQEVTTVSFKISDATNSLDKSQCHDVCFYDLKDDNLSYQKFIDRLSISQSGLVIVPETKHSVSTDRCIVVKRDCFLEAQKILCDAIYPYNKLSKIVGVTGTNGKTTTVYLAMQLAASVQKSSLSIGTLGLYDQNGKVNYDTGMTTPSYIEIRKILSLFKNNYSQYYFEVSSHAIDQRRFYKIDFDVCAWTSFSQDHLDYHKSMDEYFKAKCGILDYSKITIVPWREKKLIERLSSNMNKIRVTDPLDKIPTGPFWSADYNLSNLEVALSLNIYLGNSVIFSDFANLLPPPGRFQPVKFAKSVAYIDYAHTPDALENVLIAIKKSYKEKKMITVFGCGGDRDRTKRPLMGEVACRHSDIVIITSDNPRSEDPTSIINDILLGIKKECHVIIEVERKSAMLKAVALLNEDSVLLVAGKGHENYQEISGIKHPFDDYQILSEISENNYA
jgi:UDP-N-acetylmuramoyl-L-alanyl-D-glutamate--2,6-diaminopimelate ligase